MKVHYMNSMKYRALAIITALLCIGAAQAEPLDEEEARPMQSNSTMSASRSSREVPSMLFMS